jgi:flagellar biosynthesis/type III secretory pathway protein FliH
MPRGRLLKKNQQEMLGKLNVEEYPWKEFSPETILLTDNQRKSVVLAKSHPVQELNKKVVKPSEFSRTFGQPAKTLLPQDMTAEFLASQEELRQRKRRMQMDEDEVVALELLDLEEDFAKVQETPRGQSDAASTGQENAGAVASATSVGRTAAPDISDLSSLTSHKGKGLTSRGLDFTLNEITQEKLDAEVQAAFERGLEQGRHEGEQTAMQIAAQNVPPPVETVEVEQPQVNEELIQQSYNDGLQAGLQQGREDAALDAEQKYNHSMQLLKGELLSTGREIFAEIAQMCADKILRKHIQWNDEALRSVFTAAMSQFQAQDELKIEMHPEDVARLEQQIPAEQRSRLRLVSNTKLARGDIKIEANHEVVSFDIQKTVEAVIDSLKDELFDEEKKDSTTEKAG